MNVQVIRPDTCKSCKFSDLRGDARICRGAPPTVFMLPVPGQPGQVQFISQFPPVADDEPACAAYVKRVIFAELN